MDGVGFFRSVDLLDLLDQPVGLSADVGLSVLALISALAEHGQKCLFFIGPLVETVIYASLARDLVFHDVAPIKIPGAAGSVWCRSP